MNSSRGRTQQFLQPRSSAIQRDSDDASRSTKHGCDLCIAVTMLVSKNHDLHRTRPQFRDCVAKFLPSRFVRVDFVSRWHGFETLNSIGKPLALARADCPQRHVDGRAVEIPPRVCLEIRRMFAFQQPYENV